MAYKLSNGDIARNLQEQVLKNKQDILRHYEVERVLADWGIRVIGRLDEWEVPTGTFNYGDAYAVGPDGGPFVFYIYTRGNPDYWFDYGAISIVGPQGPVGPAGIGERGERGSKWFIGSNAPTGDIKENDIWLRVSTNGSTDGFVYMYQNGNWALATSIKGPAGINGVGIASARIENNNLVITYSNGESINLGRVVGRNGNDGANGITSLVYIIGSLPEGSIISGTYDPATQEPNAGVLMPVGGVQHVFIVVDGNWTDAGPYSGGSAIYANGEYQQTFDADTKLTKITNPSQGNSLYGVLENQQRMVKLDYANYATPNALPQRGTPNGAIYIPDNSLTGSGNIPIGQRAVNKNYVDNAIAAAHGELQHTTLEWFKNESTQFKVDFGVYISPNFPAVPQNAQICGIGGYILSGGSYIFNGPSFNVFDYSLEENNASITSYYPGSNNGSSTAQFTINEVSLEGTVATFTLTANDMGPDGGIFTFDCVPHSPNQHN